MIEYTVIYPFKLMGLDQEIVLQTFCFGGFGIGLKKGEKKTHEFLVHS